MMRQVPAPRAASASIRSVASGGEALGEDILGWCREAFGIAVNEFYGQTEANPLVGNCASPFPCARDRWAERPRAPCRSLRRTADLLQAGESGIIAVGGPTRVMFLGTGTYPEATRAKFAGDWCLTGDVAVKDDDGYIWYKGREDDLISSGGYRIGPTDIEDCLMKHAAVLMAAAVGIPTLSRRIVRLRRAEARRRPAYPALAEEIRRFVGGRLAWYQAPRTSSSSTNCR